MTEHFVSDEILKVFGINKYTIEAREGVDVTYVDIARNMTDTRQIKYIIKNIKPPEIKFELSKTGEYGQPGVLMIETSNKRVTIRAHVFVFDMNGGIWTDYNSPESDGYRTENKGTVDWSGGQGRFVLVKKDNK
ncbi:MAG: hypothetical protein QY322_01370 [bacterium]|nr:MAG: hypothetical protein QY322_01370 [bacterium]